MDHRKQTTPAGCQYYAAWSITGDESLLEHYDDLCPIRFRINLFNAGYFMESLFNNHWTLSTADERFWRALARGVGEDNSMSLLLNYAFPNGAMHMVGGYISRDAVWISDSMAEGVQSFCLDDFIKHRYSKAHQVMTLYTADLDAWPPELASEQPELLRNPDKEWTKAA